MLQYEVLLSAHTLLRPLQLQLQVSAALSGTQLAGLLAKQVPNTRWYLGETVLEDVRALSPGDPLLLTDVPHPVEPSVGGHTRLKLYVPEGQDAGAWVSLRRGSLPIGRCAPLHLNDPKVSRVHARVVVDERSIRLQGVEGQQVSVYSKGAFRLLQGVAELRSGSRFRLGETVFEVGDPARSGVGEAIDGDQLRFDVPQRPELGRLVMLCVAALVPVLSGVLLMLLTGSMLFLAVSGISALLGVFPAFQLLGERRRWKRTVVERQRSVLAARERFAGPLGTSLVAGIDRAVLGVLPVGPPPLVFGRGNWQPASGPSSPGALRRRLSQPRTPGRRGGPWLHQVPVFAPMAAGVWQILGGDHQAVDNLLASLIARLVPQLAAGRVELVIDPSVTHLPAELLLLRNVRQEAGDQLARTVPFPALPTGMLNRNGIDSGQKIGQEPVITQVFLTARSPLALAQTLVISLHPVLSDLTEYWVDPVRRTAHLPDEQLRLDTPAQLDSGRLSRIIQTCLMRVPGLLLPGQTPGPSHLAAPNPFELIAVLGQDAHHTQQVLDFEEDGPHVLICGTTGSGKSEALRRIIADLSARYSPQDLAFALVDFKGGAGLAVFEQLPHVQLSASDLDAAGAQRTLTQLELEVVRRERMLAEHQCSDRNEYSRLPDVAPLPRLLVVVDEFRVLVESLSEASARIDRLAAVGRSLGIHLLLSTQRAAGALSGQTRANVNTVIALRVKDAAESTELVGSPIAAHLGNPGSAVICGPGHSAHQFQFALAVNPDLTGNISERGPGNLLLHPLDSFGTATAPQQGKSLQRGVQLVSKRWEHTPLPCCPFAPQLPQPGAEADQVYTAVAGSAQPTCGVVDDLPAGQLTDLCVDPSQGLLVCGLPDAGGRQLFEHLAKQDKQVLCLGETIGNDHDPAPGLRTVTGEDQYLFLEALDYLESLPSDRQLLVLVHGIARLQSLLEPLVFQRLDQLLIEVLRRGSASNVQLVVMADRDLNLLKAAGLCAEQWYFPLNSTEQLRMAWPKLPPTSPLPGRGIRFGPTAAPMTIQLLPPDLRVAPQPASDDFWAIPPADELGADEWKLEIGRSLLLGRPCYLDSFEPMFFICPLERDRKRLGELLAARWHTKLLDGAGQWFAWLESEEHGTAGPRSATICVYLQSTGSPEIALLFQRSLELGSRMVLLVPPSPRLAYDLGLPGFMLDDRRAFAVEAQCAQDLLPLSWRPLAPATRGGKHQQKQWRTITSIAGHPRAIIIES
ncbi:FtsK/SpoIIIE domain-containing protein [Glutamicibacter sp. NPDC087344]|uniref:FtsK/SpoIIIE domain-containing protein n=1 Tax=Glutamicibacter sp. NPDC087344 TaxID=3363994 RepID=UPI0038229C23